MDQQQGLHLAAFWCMSNDFVLSEPACLLRYNYFEILYLCNQQLDYAQIWHAKDQYPSQSGAHVRSAPVLLCKTAGTMFH